jgi:hypothetical protein
VVGQQQLEVNVIIARGVAAFNTGGPVGDQHIKTQSSQTKIKEKAKQEQAAKEANVAAERARKEEAEKKSLKQKQHERQVIDDWQKRRLVLCPQCHKKKARSSFSNYVICVATN